MTFFFTEKESNSLIKASVLPFVIGGLSAFCYYRYHVALPNESLVKLGLGVKSMRVGQTMFQFPFQNVHRVSLTPTNLKFNLHNMSREKIEFRLPCSYTLGPYIPDEDMGLFKTYANNFYNVPTSHIEDIVRGVVEGETRVLTAGMSVEDLFAKKDVFTAMVTEKVQADLKKFGIKVYNANIQELTDYDEKNSYFMYRKQRAIETANNTARVDVAMARRQGEVGVKEHETETRKQLAIRDAEATLAENEQEQRRLVSQRELEVIRAENQQQIQMARNQADIEGKKQEADLLKQLAEKQQEQRLAETRAKDLSQTLVHMEQTIKEAEGKAIAIKTLADAEFYKRSKEAEGLERIIHAVQPNPQFGLFYLGKDGFLQEVVNAQAIAVKGMKPKIALWNTGSSDTSLSMATDSIKQVVPLATTILEQTGLKDYLFQKQKQKQK